ncbi:MAG: hypothetical protein AB3N28_06090 [Kordiimonas sp.]
MENMLFRNWAASLLFTLHLGFNSVTAQNEPLKVTFVSTTFTYTSESEDPNIPAIVDKAVSLTDGKIQPTYLRMSDPRGWKEFLSQGEICLFDKIKTPERQKVAYYSKFPKDIYPPQRLYVRPGVVSQFENVKSLEQMLAETKLVIGIAGSVNYGTDIMPVIAKYYHRFFVLSSATDHEATLDKMLRSKRIDGILRSGAADWAGHKDFVQIPIEEADPAILGYIICPKSDRGRKIINIIDEAMAKPEFQTFILKTHLETFHQSEHVFLRKQFEEIYGNR